MGSDANSGIDSGVLKVYVGATPEGSQEDAGYYVVDGQPLAWFHVAELLKRHGHEVYVQPGFRRGSQEGERGRMAEELETLADGSSHDLPANWWQTLREAARLLRASALPEGQRIEGEVVDVIKGGGHVWAHVKLPRGAFGEDYPVGAAAILILPAPEEEK